MHEIARGKYVRFLRHDSGWEYVQRVNTTGIVVIVPVTDAGELVLVEQYRIPVGAPVIELPAGLAGDVPGEEDEAMESAARRELFEETGFEADTCAHLARCAVSAGLCDEVVDFFLMTGLRRVSEGGGDASEDIAVHIVPLPQVEAWLVAAQGRGTLVDSKVFSGLWFARSA